MKTTLDIPDELLAQLKERAARDGANVEQLAARLLAEALKSAAPNGGNLSVVRSKDSADVLPEPVITIDPATGLPVIHSPPDAPIHRMTAAEFQAVVDAANEEDDLGRAGLPL